MLNFRFTAPSSSPRSAWMRSLTMTVAGGLLSSLAWAGGSHSAWSGVSDVLMVGLPAAAAGYAYSQGDTDGLKELGLSVGSAYAAVEVVKALHESPRPDGSGNDGFPSAHTAIAFAAARYVDKRYGGDYNLYVYGAAGLTALARVEAKKHYWKDVLVGAGMGFVASEYFTHSKTVKVTVLPTPRGVALVSSAVW